MISIRNGYYAYDEFALTLDFEVQRGSRVAVIGPSGAGKSTLLSIIAGFEFLMRGELLINGNDTSLLSPASRPISMVFQDHNVFAHLTAFDNVALGISPTLKLNDQHTDKVRNSLARVGIVELADRLPGDMSGGERQRIALARVLVRDKPILLLDEPFAALGPALRRDMIDLVRELQTEKQLTLLMVTHDPADAQRIADQVMFVEAGVARAPVDVNVFFNGPRDAAVAAYLG